MAGKYLKITHAAKTKFSLYIYKRKNKWVSTSESFVIYFELLIWKFKPAPLQRITTRTFICSPDALIEGAQLSHELRRPLVLIATQVVNSLNSFWRGLQLVFIDADTLVLKTQQARESWWHPCPCSRGNPASAFPLQTLSHSEYTLQTRGTCASQCLKESVSFL